MSPGRRVVITGVASHWGAELARRLERDPSIEYLAGIDTVPPPVELERTDFIEADIRSPLLSRLLPGTEADTVVHCGILWYPEPGKPARVLHDVNVIGTLQLLAACERTETLERVVVRGSAAIYGCEGPSPCFFTEEMARKLPLRTRFQRDVSELEAYFENFARRHPRARLLHAALPAGDRPRPRHAAGPLPEPPGGPDPARLRSAPAAPPRRRRHRRARGGDRATRSAGAVNVAPSGSISLSHILRLARRAVAADPASAVRPGAGAARPAARRRPALRRRRPAAALRPRRRQPAAAQPRSATSPASTPRAPSATSPRRPRAAGSGPRSTPAISPAGSRGPEVSAEAQTGRAAGARAPRPSRTSCAACGSGSRTASTR